MRITDCDSIRPHVENDSNVITLYDSLNSDNEYNTLKLMLSKKFMNTHIYVDIKYSKHVHQMSDKLINAFVKLNMYFELSKSSSDTLPLAHLKETEFLIAMKNYVMEHPYIYAYELTPNDINDCTIDFYQIAQDMRITDSKNIREPLDNDYGRVIICDTDSIVDFVNEFHERTKKGEWAATGNMHYFIVITSELSCKLASECDENNIFETTYEVWYDQDAKSDEMTNITNILTHLRNLKIMYNSIIGSGIPSTSVELSATYNKSKDDFREQLFTYMEKRNDMFNRNSVTAIKFQYETLGLKTFAARRKCKDIPCL